MLTTEETQKVLDNFVNNVVKLARQNLKSGKSNASGDLSKSLKGEVKASKNSIDVGLFMEDYGKFIDRGVKGVKSSAKAKNSPYRYKDKKPPVRFIQTWLKRKKGKFRFKDAKSQAFAVQNIIYNYGIRETLFFTKAFEKEFHDLPDEIIEAYSLDVENFLEFVLKDN